MAGRIFKREHMEEPRCDPSARLSGSKDFLDHLLQLGFGNGPNDLVEDLPIFKENERGNSPDSILARCCGVFVHVHFRELHASLVVVREFLDDKLKGYLKGMAKVGNSGLYDTVTSEVEKSLIELVLKETGGNQLKASRLLGLNRNTLRAKIKLYKIKNGRKTKS